MIMIIFVIIAFGFFVSSVEGADEPTFNEVYDASLEVLEEKPLPDDCLDPEEVGIFMVEVAWVEAGYLKDGEIRFKTESLSGDYGPFQINLGTAKDLLSRNSDTHIGDYDPDVNIKDQLVSNYKFGAYLFREKFGDQSFRDQNGDRSAVWSRSTTPRERAEWWKKYYNTHLGAGTRDGYIRRSKIFRERLGLNPDLSR